MSSDNRVSSFLKYKKSLIIGAGSALVLGGLYYYRSTSKQAQDDAKAKASKAAEKKDQAAAAESAAKQAEDAAKAKAQAAEAKAQATEAKAQRKLIEQICEALDAKNLTEAAAKAAEIAAKQAEAAQKAEDEFNATVVNWKVKTPYGPGYLAGAPREDGMIPVVLEWDKFNARSFLHPEVVTAADPKAQALLQNPAAARFRINTPYGPGVASQPQKGGMMPVALAWDGFTARSIIDSDVVTVETKFPVQTPYGPGFISGAPRDDGMLPVKLEWDAFTARSYLNPSVVTATDLKAKALIAYTKYGRVTTPYGPGYVHGEPRDDGMIPVLLEWDAFKAKSYLHPSILKTRAPMKWNITVN